MLPKLISLSILIATLTTIANAGSPMTLLQHSAFRAQLDAFSQHDKETIATDIKNADAPAWMERNVPYFECPDKQLQEIYYFRWWSYRKHLRQTPAGFIVTEFLPDVPWAGKYNSISCAAGHHIYEGRWLRDAHYLDDYSKFWFRGSGAPRLYSFWAADAIWARYLANHNAALPVSLLPDLIKNYEGWETSHRTPNGLFEQSDNRDGMEYSIGGSGCRPTINSYMYGDAVAIAHIADLAGQRDVAQTYRAKAAQIKQLTQSKLWDDKAQFFKTLPTGDNTHLVGVREEVGFVPWQFNLPDAGYEAAWQQLLDPQGFAAPYGPTTAEQRDPQFMAPHDHDCLWNGPAWPYATTQTLVAMANLLNNYQQNIIRRGDYLNLLQTYARSQYKDGQPWVAEDLDARSGKWIVDLPRSVYYNHSAFCDLIITGLVGLRPRADNTVEINPLVPEHTWDYFCLDGLPYHGHSLTIFYDKTGHRYHRGQGLHLLVDGTPVAASDSLNQRLVAPLPTDNAKASLTTAQPIAAPAIATPSDTSAGWVKYPQNPVLGGKLGTCFDISVLKEGATFKMWFSWRPKQSIALVTSADGIHWSDPVIALGPNPQTGWEDDINRPVVIHRPDGYQMWYTGQAKGHSYIGHATSPDGITWTRASEQPVLSPDTPWEKAAVMCPDVMWDATTKRYRMWYSGGEQYEPDAIGYVTSPDGNVWTKLGNNPIFQADPQRAWEQHKVTACQVVQHGDWYYMFYIGFRDVDHAQIGIARSRDGIHNWQRHPANPIIRPTPDDWDHDATYKPSVVFDGQRWLLWYNGRHGGVEQIGLATHEGEDLGF